MKDVMFTRNEKGRTTVMRVLLLTQKNVNERGGDIEGVWSSGCLVCSDGSRRGDCGSKYNGTRLAIEVNGKQ